MTDKPVRAYSFPTGSLRTLFPLLIWACFLAANLALPQHGFAKDNKALTARDPKLNALANRLVADGFSESGIRKLFAGKGVSFHPKGVALFFAHNESKLNYGQFLKKSAVSKGRKYIKKHKKTLALAQKKYGVAPENITAILLVETRLGKYLGRRKILTTLVTMASLTEPAHIEEIWKNIPKSKKPSRHTFDKKIGHRCPWAYKELKALLRYAKREKISPSSLKGSYAGAMGIPQFIPSKALSLGVDGNGDGKVDLFTHEDAIFSVANYLVHFGWKQGMTDKEKHKVLFEYNHSNIYVDTLIQLAEKL